MVKASEPHFGDMAMTAWDARFGVVKASEPHLADMAMTIWDENRCTVGGVDH